MSTVNKFLDISNHRFRLLSKVRIVRFIHKQKSGYYDRMTKRLNVKDTIIDCLKFYYFAHRISRSTSFNMAYKS
jgi:hypothetical protein